MISACKEDCSKMFLHRQAGINKLLLFLVSLSKKLHMVRTMNIVNNINMITYRYRYYIGIIDTKAVEGFIFSIFHQIPYQCEAPAPESFN